MKSYLLLLCCCLCQIIVAQQFVEVPGTKIENVGGSAIAFADVDGDSDQDVLVTGQNSIGLRVLKLYTNDGVGNFTEKLFAFSDLGWVTQGAVAFADVDGDNDQDLLVTGLNRFDTPISKLYINDGTGDFTEMQGTPFTGVWRGAIAFADVDGDGDQDVLITGRVVTNTNSQISTLYRNDGMGNFTQTSEVLIGVDNGSVAFADIDGDNDQDLLITGFRIADESTILYRNNGSGNFTIVSGTPFVGASFSSIAFADVDGDNDQDVLITGINGIGRSSKLYRNNGSGNFTEVGNIPFEGVRYSSIAFADVDGDNDQDVIISGESESGNISKLYRNGGAGNFSEMMNTPFVGVQFGSVAFADVDGDGHEDVLITGLNSSFEGISKLYTNDGMGNFTELTPPPFDAVGESSIAFSDVNGDGHEDVLITGENSSFERISKLYTNDGIGNFTEMTGTPFEGVEGGSIAFSDVNGDGHEDVLITGENGSERISKLYTNDGMGNFTEMTGTPFEGVFRGSIAFSDVNGDGHEDVLITGFGSNDRISKLYTNDGMGNFTEMTGTPFEGVEGGSIAFSDVNGDGHEDVLITGFGSAQISKLYTNDGMGNFTEMTGTPFEGVSRSSIAFSDVNGDGHEDVLITGWNFLFDPISKLYTNDGMGNFTEMTGTPFDGVYRSSIAFSDVNGDGHEDVLITGRKSADERISKLYTNDGMGNFTEITGTPFEGVSRSSIAFSDVNGDGHEDVLITGLKDFVSFEPITKLYTNFVLQGDLCGNAEPIDNLFGGPDNEPQTSSILSNIGYDANGDQGENCFEFDNLDATRWFSFTGDGNTYRIAVPTCGGDMPLQNDDSQIILYSGSCTALQQVACNDDETEESFMAAVTIETQPGVNYRFLVDGYGGFIGGTNANPEGQFCLEVTKIGSLPACDNPAIAFDGVDDYVDIGPNRGNFGADDFTFEMMVKTSQTVNSPANSHVPLAGKRPGCNCDENFWYLSLLPDGKAMMEIFPDGCMGGISFRSTTIINDDNWHHIAFTRVGDFFVLYIDGTEEASQEFAGVDEFNNMASLQLGSSGCTEAGFGGIFQGQMDEVRAWNYARSAEEINTFRNREVDGSEDGLTAYFNFNDGRPGEDNTGRIGSIDLTGSASVARMIAFDRSGTNSNWVTGTTSITQLDRDEDGLYDACNEPDDLPTATRFEEIPGVSLGQSYPNPAAGEVTIPIKLGGLHNEAELRFTSAMGQTVKVHQVPQGTDQDLEVAVSDLPAGIYFYSLFVRNRLVDTKRMVITR